MVFFHHVVFLERLLTVGAGLVHLNPVGQTFIVEGVSTDSDPPDLAFVVDGVQTNRTTLIFELGASLLVGNIDQREPSFDVL